MTSFSHSIAIKAPKEKVFEIISDFGRYPKFIPEVEDVTVHSKTKNRAKATFTVNLMKMVNYTLDLRLNPPDKIAWTLIEGEFMESNDGSWVFTQLDKNLTDATFSVDIGFPFWVPSSLADGAIKSTMPKMMKHFKIEAEKKGAKTAKSTKKKATKR